MKARKVAKRRQAETKFVTAPKLVQAICIGLACFFCPPLILLFLMSPD